MRIVSVGETTVDVYPDLKRDYVGGISLNFAIHAKRAGAQHVSLVSCIGKGEASRILEKLKSEAIDCSHVSIRSGMTARQEIVLASNGDRIFPPGGYEAGVLENFRPNASDLEFIQIHDVLAVPFFLQMETLCRHVISPSFKGWLVADFLDLSDHKKNPAIIAEFTDRLTIAFISGDAEIIEQLRPLSRATRCLIVVTLGSSGSVALMNGEPVFQKAPEVTNVVDSTGCGDAFQAAFTVSYWHDRDIRRALKSGTTHAARVLTHYGAVD